MSNFNLISKVLDQTEFLRISRALESHHALFYKLWEMGQPFLDPQVSTAQVEFDRDGKLVAFVFNPDLYDALSDYGRLFVFCHEILHVVLNHGIRIQDAMPLTESMINQVLDLVVNHMLVDKFGFDRSRIDKELCNIKYGNQTKGIPPCWIDTVFSGFSLVQASNDSRYRLIPSDSFVTEQEKLKAAHPSAQLHRRKIPVDQSFEWYFSLLKQAANKFGLDPSVIILDDHQILGAANQQDVNDVLENLSDSLSQEEKEDLQGVIQKHFQKSKSAGTSSGFEWSFVRVGQVQPKRKWETVIRTWMRRYWSPDFKQIEQWARLSRRFSLLPNDLMLPTELEVEHDHTGVRRILVWFFLDASGSCWDLKDRFFKAALSLPKDRFDVQLFTFDTRVHETTLESRKVKGGGGTSFSVLETHIQTTMKKNHLNYPEAVFVMTDGYGNRVQPQFPDRWFWFLSVQHTSYIPTHSKTFMLRDFE